MPHVIVKMFPGRSEEQKTRIAEEMTKALMLAADCTEKSVSIAIEEVAKEDWVEDVYKPDILAKADSLYRKPGYDPL
jgi:4-oxalocrotonate tautomerase